MRVRWQPKTLILAFSAFFIIISGATTFWGLGDGIFELDENQILYLFSTSAQVLAGVYGLTLTGFVFFRNELSREEFEDETLADAVESLKRRYFTLLLFITILVLLTFALSNAAISVESSGRAHVTTILINVGQAAFATSLVAISYFIFDVISPKRIEAASRALQEKADPKRSSETRGSLEEFLRNYNQIELLLLESGESYGITSTSSSRTRYPRRASNSRLAEALLFNGRINKSLFLKLRELITLRNSIIHGAEPTVSADAVDISRQVLADLTSAIRLEPQ